MSQLNLLRSSDLFSELPDESLGLLANYLQKRTFAKGMILFHKGSPGHNLYIVESGRIRIFALSETGREISLTSFGPGESFGELSLLDGLPRSAGAIATEKTVVYLLNRRDFLLVLEQNFHICRRMLEIVSHRMRNTIAFAESLAFLDVYGRVATVLLEMAESVGKPGDGDEVRLRLTQTELASYVAASRERINQVLGSFRDQGLIRTEGKSIILRDPAQLRRHIQY